MKIGIIGIGLIGGSFALAAKRHLANCVCYGSDQNASHLQQALEKGIVQAPLEALDEMDVVVVAIPVDAAKGVLPSVLNQVHSNALVMDVGSTKTAICKILELHPKRAQFLATHPIAGTEFSGPDSAFESLLVNKVQIICESEKTRPDLLEQAINQFEKMKMQVHEMNPTDHDQHIAYVSHLSHVSSFMLGKTVMEKEKDERAIFKMAGSGFASTVRLAKSSPEMWTPIFRENKKHLLKVLDAYIKNLSAFKEMMDQDDFNRVFDEMKNINNIRKILEGIPAQHHK